MPNGKTKKTAGTLVSAVKTLVALAIATLLLPACRMGPRAALPALAMGVAVGWLIFAAIDSRAKKDGGPEEEGPGEER